MKVLITGASGFIGRNLVEWLGERYTIAAPSSSELDLLGAVAVRQYLCEHHFDVVVHAATTRSNRRLGASADMLDRNCRMFFNLARNEGLFGKMIYFGSGAAYDRTGLPPRVPEDYFDTRVPADPYGFSKYVCAKYSERAERLVELRLFAVFGKYEAWEVRFISNACCRAIHGLPIVVRQNVRFDYLDIADLAQITAWFIEHEGERKAYNVCRGAACELTELARIVADVSGRNPQIVIKNPELGQEYSGDNRRLLAEMGPYAFREPRRSIQELYAWYADHKDMIDPGALRFDG